MKVLVTGGTGFVGSHLIESLLRRGDQVTALARSRERAAHLERVGVRLVVGDLDSVPALEDACRDQDVIYHVAGLVAAKNESAFLHVNRDGAARLTRAAGATSSAKLVLVSSLAAGGPAIVGQHLVGTEPPRPVTAYGRSKAAGEAEVRRYPGPWCIIRPPALYGPRDTEMLRIFRVTRSGLAPVFGRGTQQLSLLYGPDLALALIAAGTSAATNGNTYYACHREIVTSADLVRMVGRSQGKSVILLQVPRFLATIILSVTGGVAALAGRATILSPDKIHEFFAAAWTCDPTPLQRDTGWTAGHDIATGIPATLAWYRKEGWM